MDERLSWTMSVQGKTPGNAVDKAVGKLTTQLGKVFTPDNISVQGPFPPQMRLEAAENAVDNVYDITIRWY